MVILIPPDYDEIKIANHNAILYNNCKIYRLRYLVMYCVIYGKEGCLMLRSDPLWYLIQISKCNSMSIAAELLHISQPSLTVAIKKLEEQLNTKLLNRHYNGVSLTADGEKVVALAKQAFSYFDQIEAIGQKQEENTLDDVVIYCNPSLSSTLVKSFSAYGRNRNQFIPIINTTPSIKPEKMLQDNPNYVFFGIVPETIQLSSFLDMHVLNMGHTCIMCAADFAQIPENKKYISFKELLKLPLVLNRNALYFQAILFEKLCKLGQPIVYAEASDNGTYSAMIAAGLGVGFTNSLFGSEEQRDLRTLRVRNAPQFSSALVYNRNIDPHKLETILQIVQKNLSNNLKTS